MAFKPLRTRRELEIISLIDIVFLLLIFGIVVSCISRYERMLGEVGKEVGIKSHLSIHVYRETTDEAAGTDLVEIIYPNNKRTYFESFPPDNVLLGLDSAEFANLPACKLISTHLGEYISEYLQSPDTTNLVNHIDIRVAGDTKFRIVGFIINQCSGYWRYISWMNLGLRRGD